MNKKIIALGILAIAGVLVVSGCKSASEKAAEKTVEKAIENATNGNADVDVSTNTVTMNYNGGSIQAGQNVSLPSGFPTDVYIPDGATLTAAATTEETEGYTVSFTTTQSVDEMKSKYESELEDSGWTISGTSSYMNTATIFATKGDRQFTMGASLDVNQTRVTLTTFTNSD